MIAINQTRTNNKINIAMKESKQQSTTNSRNFGERARLPAVRHVHGRRRRLPGRPIYLSVCLSIYLSLRYTYNYITHVHACVCVHVYVYIYIYIYIYNDDMYVYIYIYIYIIDIIYMYKYMYISYIYIYIHMYIHIFKPSLLTAGWPARYEVDMGPFKQT